MTEADGPARIRLDRWLFHTRMFSTRTLAADRISGGGIRVNGAPCRKPAHMVGPGDVVTIGGKQPRILRFRAPGARRGAASEAQGLYDALHRPDAVADDDANPTDSLEPARPADYVGSVRPEGRQ